MEQSSEFPQEKICDYDFPRREPTQTVLLRSLLKKERHRLAKGKVLVMDCDEALRPRLCIMLASCGYEPVLADCRKARETFSHFRETCRGNAFVIVSLGIPQTSRVIKSILKCDPAARVIVASPEAHPCPDLQDHLAAVIRKPYRIRQLKRVLQDLASQVKESEA